MKTPPYEVTVLKAESLPWRIAALWLEDEADVVAKAQEAYLAKHTTGPAPVWVQVRKEGKIIRSVEVWRPLLGRC